MKSMSSKLIGFFCSLTLLFLVSCQTTQGDQGAADSTATSSTGESQSANTASSGTQAPAAAASSTQAGINVYSETARNQTLVITKQEAASANSTASIELDSSAVPALEGSKVIALNPGTGAWGGGFVQFDPIDASKASNLIVGVNFKSAEVPKSMEVKLEAGTVGNSFNLMLQPSEAKGDWVYFTIPLAQFVEKVGIGYANARLPGLDAIKNVGFWNPGVQGVIYFDDIHFE